MVDVGVLIAGLLAALSLLWFLLLRRRREGEPPVENGWIPYLGCALAFRANPLQFLQTCQKKYGDTFTCKIAGNFITFITDPIAYSSVTRHGKYLDFNNFGLKVSRKVFGHVDFNDAKYEVGYEEIHQIFNKTLQGRALDPLISSMMGNLQFVVSQIKSSLDSDAWITGWLNEFSSKIMFEAGFLTIFGKNEKAMKAKDIEKVNEQHAAILTALENFKVFDTSFPTLAGGIPILFLKAAKESRMALEQMLTSKFLNHSDKKSLLIEERMNLFDRSPTLNDRDKARTHLAMLWASQANTLPACFWSIYYVLRYPEALKAVRNEIDDVLHRTNQKIGDTNNPIVFSKEQLDSMTVTGSLINEALRLSSASLMVRVATTDFVLPLDSDVKVAVRKGDHVCLYPQLLHLDPDIYEDPLEFKYDRFLDENGKEKTAFHKNGRKLKHYLLPFGSGVSLCPGRFFAINEIKEFLSISLCYFDMELLDPSGPIPPTDNSRFGLGIVPPVHDVQFRYRLK